MSRAANRVAARALSARTYLLRSPRRTVPVALVQALVTALLVTVITPTNIFERTAEAYLRPLAYFTIVTPQVESSFGAELSRLLDENPHQEARRPAKILWIETPALIGKLTSPLLALGPDDQSDFLGRVGDRLVRGTLPAPGSDGAAIHEDLLRARGLHLGDAFGRIVDPHDTTPGKFEVVGVLDGPARLGVTDFGYASIPSFVLARQPSFEVIYAKPGEKAASDAWLRGREDASGRARLQVLDEERFRERVDEDLANLPIFLGFITGAVAVIVALVTALLYVITFQARQDEFALFLAVGHPRGRLVEKLTVEATVTALVGWAAGLGLGLLVLTLYDAWFVAPRAIVMQVVDPRPLLFSLSVPVLSATVSALALARRLRRMDPVAVIQRRGAG